MNDKIEKPTMQLTPLRKICMTIGQLPTSYVESMSYYEMLVWFVHYLRDEVIPVVNANGEATKELQELFVELQEYVNNYFDNLDVQEEINNKLDEMAESGQLTDIIAQYLGLAGMITFNNVSEMKLAQNLVNGSKCCTLGFYNVNDGGNAIYKIRTITNQDNVDEMTIIALYDNNLIAELIENNDLIPKQLGVKGDGSTDDSISINNVIQLAQNKNKTIKFTQGTYIISSIIVLDNVNIIGENATLKVKNNLCIDSNISYYPIILKNNTKLENITIDGNKNNNSLYSVADLITTQGDNIQIKNNILKNVIDSGIMFSETINSVCENNKIEDARDCGIYCNNNNSNKIMNSCIKGNYIKNATSSGIAMKRGCRYLDIKDNYLINCEFGITNEQADTTTDFSKEFNIINNTIINNNIGSYGIDARCGFNSNIIGNRIINYLSSIIIQGCHDINVENNIIEFYSSTTLLYNHYGILLTGRNVTGFNYCYNINVINNILISNYYDQSTNAQVEIRINSSDNTSNINIIGNKITTNDYGEGITTSSNVHDLIIQNNTIKVGTGKNALGLQGRNYCTGNIVVNGNDASTIQYFARDRFHKYYTNDSTNAPTSQTYYNNGDVVFAKYGSSSNFAWMYDGTNFKHVDFS